MKLSTLINPKRLLGFSALLLTLFAVSCETQEPLNPTLEEVQTLDGKPTTIPGKYIVVLHEDNLNYRKTNDYEQAQAGMRKVAQDIVAKYGVSPTQVDRVYGSLLTGFSASLSPSQVAALRNDPSVYYIEEDGYMYAFNTIQSPATWGIDRIDQTALPIDNNYSYSKSGAGVTAYIIDTGIRTTHNEFGGRAVRGFDAFAGGTSEDCNGHGTHVAGTVGGTTYGVAKGVRLVAVRVLDCNGSGTNSGVIAGMDWVASHSKSLTGPSVANMSLGGGASTATDDAVKRMFDAGVPVIVAAGNGDRLGKEQPACNYSPARAPQAYTVGATTNTDSKTSWSNYGSCVNIFAPGADITAAWHTSNTATNRISGTSMASPHVAGVAALFLEGNNTASPAQVYDYLTTTSTKGIVTNSKTTANHLLYSLGTVAGGGDTGGGDTGGGEINPITLTATWVKVSGRLRVTLKYSGITGSEVEIYRGSTKILRPNDGEFVDNTNLRGSGTVTYKVCAKGSTTACSPEVTINYN